MAGIGEDVGKYIAEGVESVGSRAVKEIGEHIPISYKGLFAPERTFQQAGPVGKDLWDLHKNRFIPKKNEVESLITKGVQNPATAHPSVKPIVDKIITAHQPNDPKIMDTIRREAGAKASADVYGPNRVVIQAGLKHIAKTDMNMADMISDHYHIMFREAQPDRGGFTKFQQDMSIKRAGEEGFRAPASPYKGTNEYERGVQKWRRLLSYGAAPVHVAQAAINTATQNGYMPTFKAAMQIYGPGEAEANLLASNSISELHMSPLREQMAFESGKIHQYAPGGVGEFIHKNMFIPGMANARRRGLEIAAQTGKVVAEEAAYRLQKGDTKYALQVFKRLDIDPAKIVEQKFQLHPEDIQKAYYHGANNTVFLDPYDNTPTFWRQSPLFRGIKAFSGYTAKQSEFLRNTLMDQVRAGDHIGVARTVATWSLAVPLIGATLAEFDRLRHGEDWDAPGKHWFNRMDATVAGQTFDYATGRKQAPIPKTVYNEIYLLSYLSAWGNATGYLRGANRASLAGRLLPPEIRQGVQLGQNAMKATTYDSKKHKDAAKPLGRDLLSDIPSMGMGTIASHIILPTRKELAKNKIHRPRRTPIKQQTWSPYDFNPDLDF